MGIAAALADATARLTAAGVPEPRADAEVLLAHVLGTDRTALVVAGARPLPAGAAGRFGALLAERAARVPVFHLVGEREFWSLPIAVDRRVLVPRPETELVVETARMLAGDARRVLDAGTGSGAIAAALVRELPTAAVWASDRDADALAVARRNLARLAPAVRLVRSDWLAAFSAEVFDLVVANPPYVAEGEFASLAPEVRDHEPRAALIAGADGLAAIRVLVTQAARVLVPGGWLVLEMGQGHADAVQRLVVAHGGYGRTLVRQDHAGIERVLASRSRAAGGRGGDEWIRS